MTVHNALRRIFVLANPDDSLRELADVKKMLVGERKNTVYKAAFNRDLKKNVTVSAFDILANELCVYLSGNAAMSRVAFDEWHAGVCDRFITELNSALSCDIKKKKYGKAQKALNMAGKYLYCCNDAVSQDVQAKFQYFHIALDGYTHIGANRQSYPLSFYRDVVIPWKYEKMPRGVKKSWSGLEKNEYTSVVDDIREFFEAHPHTFNEYLNACHAAGLFGGISTVESSDRILTPFEAEFFLWEICKRNERGILLELFGRP